MINKQLLSSSIIFILLFGSCAPAGSKYPPNKPFSPVVDLKYVDLSPLSGVPCAAPCWHNLVVEKSTKEQTLVTLGTLGFIDQTSIKEITSRYWDPSYETHDSALATTITASCLEPKDMQCYEFDFVINVLKRIIIFPNYTITLQDTVDYFGNPTCVSLFQWGAECAGCGINFSWDNRQISVSVLDTRCGDGSDLCVSIRRGGEIPPDYVIQTIVYYPQAWMGHNSQECFSLPGFAETIP
jgi:hypothetical protein